MVKKGFICGTWDLFHAGHVLALAEAKNHCDHLIVGLQSENVKRKPIQELFARYVQLNACIHVDEIWPYSTENDLKQLLESQKFNIQIRFLGQDYCSPNKKITAENAITIHYLDRTHDYSTTAIINTIIEREY